MATFADDVLPLPITYLQRHKLATLVWETALPGKPFPGLKTHLEVAHDGPFRVKLLDSNQHSFYKSLSWYIFATEDNFNLVHNAIVKHARDNTSTLNKIFLKERPYDDESKNVFDYLRNSARTNRNASLIDVYTAAHFLKFGIALFDSKEHTQIKVIGPECVEKHTDKSDHLFAILLSWSSSGDKNTFHFEPIRSYTRSKHSTSDEDDEPEIKTPVIKSTQTEFVLCLTKEELNSNVVLADTCNNSYVTIPYVIAKTYSDNLAEFVGEILETGMSATTLQKLKAYMIGPTKYLSTDLNAGLYEFARRWKIQSLVNEIDNLVYRSSLNNVINFANDISLSDSSQFYRYIETLVYRSKIHDLKRIHINSKSEYHIKLNSFLDRMIIAKENSKPLASWYKLPHVLVCIDTESRYFGQYFNGETWCSLFLSESIKRVLPFLLDNKYCVLNDTLYFIKDKHTLGEVQLINNHTGVVTYNDIPLGVSNPRIAITSDKTTMLLISNETDRKVAEVLKISDSPTSISPWRTIPPEQYTFTFVEQGCILYEIENYKLSLKTDAVRQTQALVTVHCSAKSTEIYHYEITDCQIFAERRATNNLHRVQIPKQKNETSKFFIVSFPVFAEHFAAYYA
jgi:hypothetical protein